MFPLAEARPLHNIDYNEDSYVLYNILYYFVLAFLFLSINAFYLKQYRKKR